MQWRHFVLAGILLTTACSGPERPTATATLEPLSTPTPRPTPRLAGLPVEDSTDIVPLDPDLTLPGPPSAAVFGLVTRVIDGDTIVLDGIGVGERDTQSSGRRARLIGVDTPEVSGGTECYGREATTFTRTALDGADVLVSFDVETTDRFGRALVYVWTLDSVFFNARLLQDGFANQLTIPPNVRYADLFTELARAAREADRGLWSACEESAPSPSNQATSGGCHASYPDFCIPPPPPDLDCPDIDRKAFTVRHDVQDPDPHRFDGDRDGVGCET